MTNGKGNGKSLESWIGDACLNPNAFLGYHFPLPPMEVQQHVKRVADLAAIKRAKQKTAADLEKALLPALLDRVFNG